MINKIKRKLSVKGFANGGIGTISSPYCVTSVVGSCEISVNVGYNDIELKDSLHQYSHYWSLRL